MIERLQQKLGAKLISYTASSFHPLPEIIIQDIPLFEDLLRSVAGAGKGYLMINSPGGDADAAEKLLKMCRQRFHEEFSVIVPDYAKSAATMIALGSDKILMGYLAELGPIDPQLRTAAFGGETIPARSFIDGLEIIRKKVLEDRDPVMLYLPMMSQIRPELLARCKSAIESSREFAEKWLKTYMLRNDPKQAEKVAKLLSEGETYKSHGKVIDFDEAKNALKLNAERIDPNSDLWGDVWELYRRQIQWLQQHQAQGAAKLFESESVSLTLNVQIQVFVQPPVAPPRQPPPVPPSPVPPQASPSPKKNKETE